LLRYNQCNGYQRSVNATLISINASFNCLNSPPIQNRRPCCTLGSVQRRVFCRGWCWKALTCFLWPEGHVVHQAVKENNFLLRIVLRSSTLPTMNTGSCCTSGSVQRRIFFCGFYWEAGSCCTSGSVKRRIFFCGLFWEALPCLLWAQCHAVH
jgi:hypothetical protein